MPRRERVSDPLTANRAHAAFSARARPPTRSLPIRTAPMLVAHRGSTGPGAPENTMAAFQAAVSLGADFIETDIHRTCDGVLVLHHDPVIGTEPLRTLSFALARAATAGQHAPLPTLEELLLFATGRIRLNLELKEAGYEDEVVALLRLHALAPGSVVLTSFLESALLSCKAHAPETRCGLLLEPRERPEDMFPEQRLRATGADFVVAHQSLVHSGFAPRLRDAGFPVWVWTVNDSARLAILLHDPGVQAIITDRISLGQAERALQGFID